MEILGLRQDVPRDPVAQVLKHKGSPIALVDLGRDASESVAGGVVHGSPVPVRRSHRERLAATDDRRRKASGVFPVRRECLSGDGQSGNTMTIGTGVGSAVMEGGKIVAQAPFVAASGALMPVVAPMLLFATVSSVMICARLDRVQRSLGRLFDVVEAVRRHLDAEDYARFETAVEQIEDIRSEFEHCQRFCQ